MRWLEDFLDRLANLLPPPTPTRFSIFSYRVTRLDIAIAIGALLIIVLGIYLHGLLWGLIYSTSGLALAFTWFNMADDNPPKS
jgi:hypothetical protein